MKPFITALIILLLVLTGVTYAAHDRYPQIDTTLLYGGNIILFVVTLVSYILVQKSMSAKPEAFVRGVYSGTFLKMLILIIALVVYVMIHRDHLDKGSLFAVFGYYMLYAILETYYLGKLAQKNRK